MAIGTLMILGSGEIAPGMVKVYRESLSSLNTKSGVMLDTPFGFQENIPQLTEKIVDYFATSLQITLAPASFLRRDAATPLEVASFIDAVRRAPFVFAGPGSPSYAMRQWGPVDFGSALSDVLDAGGIVCFSSAAALTLGRFTAPIYELYKVGESPFWIDGLNVLEKFGLRCVVIPHYDNAEGGNHDTRFCYLGELRLRVLESMLDPDVATLGVDEHTAVIIDANADTISVRGRSHAYWRSGSTTLTLETNSVTPLATLRNAPLEPREQLHLSLKELSDAQQLGEVVSNGGPDMLAALAKLVHLAESGGSHLIEPTSLVEGVLKARADARAAGQYALSDELRDLLVEAGIEVHDTRDGATWTLRAP